LLDLSVYCYIQDSISAISTERSYEHVHELDIGDWF